MVSEQKCFYSLIIAAASSTRKPISPMEPQMTTIRPSSFLMTAFVAAATLIVMAAATPIVQVAASVVA